jgi:hypothetical protein
MVRGQSLKHKGFDFKPVYGNESITKNGNGFLIWKQSKETKEMDYNLLKRIENN